MEKPTLKRGRRDAQYLDSEIYPGKRRRVEASESLTSNVVEHQSTVNDSSQHQPTSNNVSQRQSTVNYLFQHHLTVEDHTSVNNVSQHDSRVEGHKSNGDVSEFMPTFQHDDWVDNHFENEDPEMNDVSEEEQSQRQAPLVERFVPPESQPMLRRTCVKFKEGTNQVENIVKITLKDVTQYYEDRMIPDMDDEVDSSGQEYTPEEANAGPQADDPDVPDFLKLLSDHMGFPVAGLQLYDYEQLKIDTIKPAMPETRESEAGKDSEKDGTEEKPNQKSKKIPKKESQKKPSKKPNKKSSKKPDKTKNKLDQTNTDSENTDTESENEDEESKKTKDKLRKKENFLYNKERPFSSIAQIFDDLADKVIERGFLRACEPFQKQGLQLVTMCSGTESPVIAMQLLKEAIESKASEHQNSFNFKHVASAEIVPFKQAYIQRNFAPPILFRDVTEFNDRYCKPHTAFGGIAAQPDKVHMLVAGASCVDYSSLNNAKKGFGQKGQSYSTFMGIISYCEWAQPPIVVLENVDSAPWPQIVDSLEIIGYAAICFKLDSKDFYIPQTRQRGYVIAFHKKTAEDKGFDLKAVFTTLHETLQSLACSSSAPFTDFIYGDNDPQLFVTRKLLTNPERNNVRRSNVAWTASRHRYICYRATNKLGVARPYTQWRVDGTCSPFDSSWIEWMRTQPERIWDTIDIKYLGHLAENKYDMNYKNRWAELSQNVDRDRDNRPWGIVSCLTPTGIPWESRRGGPVSGKEVLALQAIPDNKLLLNRETSRMLQDLTGNAMTCTVVGAVVMSALLVSHKHTVRKSKSSPSAANDSMFDYFPDLPDLDVSPELRALQFESLVKQLDHHHWPLVPTKHNESSKHEFDKHDLVTIAKKTMRLCSCEGPINQANSVIKICIDCGHTCCLECAGNPQHNYSKGSPQSGTKYAHMPQALRLARLPPWAFANYIRNTFPTAIDLLAMPYLVQQLRDNFQDCKDAEIQEYIHLYSETIEHAVQGTYVFSGVQRNSI